MRKSVGLAVGAAVLAVTIGVLIGLVVHISKNERAGTHTPAGSAGSTTMTGSGSITGSASSAPDPGGLGTAATDNGASLTGATAEPSAGSLSSPPPGQRPGASARHSAGSTPGSLTSSSSAVDQSSNADSSSNVGTAETTVTETPPTIGPTMPPGSAMAEKACPSLAARSANASGTTLFCQHNQSDGSLQWRAVIDGGGCLNQTMTGTGSDGHSYVCQLGDNGLNHWHRADAG